MQGREGPLAILGNGLRLVRLEAGSAAATLVPIRPTDDLALPTGDLPRARVVLDKLMDAVDERRPLPRDVARALEGARMACGHDGAFTVSTTGVRDREVAFTQAAIAAVTPPEEDRDLVRGISGRLSRLAESPEALVRSPDGTEWACSYDASMAPKLQNLWRTAVRASGEGHRTSPRKGAFRLEAVDALVEGTQTQFFSAEHVPTDVLLERQGIGGARGLAAVGAALLFDEDVEEAYLSSVFGDASS